MGTIRMKIQALDWTMGEVGNVFIGLKGGECMIDWGDGHTSTIQAHPHKIYPQYVSHVYPSNCKSSGDIFDVVISSTEDNIVFLNTGCIDMAILDLDLSKCPELERLDLTRQVKILDTRFNISLRKLLIYNAQGTSLDLSCNHNLEELEIKGYDNSKLNISRCNKLWYLDCGNSRMREILVSNSSALKEIIFREECPLTPRSLSYVNRTLERNNGTMTITTYQ